MGSAVSRLVKMLFARREMRILMVGLDAVGKTTILYKLKLGKVIYTIPTVGFNVETVDYKNVSFTVWDVAAQDKIRPLWRHYFQNTQGLIFVVDSNDKERILEARDELHRLLGEDIKKCNTLSAGKTEKIIRKKPEKQKIEYTMLQCWSQGTNPSVTRYCTSSVTLSDLRFYLLSMKLSRERYECWNFFLSFTRE